MLRGMSDDVPPMPAFEPAVPVTPGSRRSWLLPSALGFVAGVVATLLVVLIVSASGGSGSFTLRGTLDLSGDHIPVEPQNTACTGNGAYSDIDQGAEVTVYDDSGKVIAVGSLGAGHYADQSNYTGDCIFPITVSGVPDGGAIYQVEVAHRGKLAISNSNAKAGLYAAKLGD